MEVESASTQTCTKPFCSTRYPVEASIPPCKISREYGSISIAAFLYGSASAGCKTAVRSYGTKSIPRALPAARKPETPECYRALQLETQTSTFKPHTRQKGPTASETSKPEPPKTKKAEEQGVEGLLHGPKVLDESEVLLTWSGPSD